MRRRPSPGVQLRPWTFDDLGLMEALLGDPLMTEHLGGPESPGKLRERLDTYVNSTAEGAMSVVTIPPGRPVGSIGYWAREWQGGRVWETGWSVLPAYQGRGIATRALQVCLARARAVGSHRWVHAFPSVDNGPSNAVCRKAGFTRLGVYDFEYPKGNWLRCNDWALDLEVSPMSSRTRGIW